MPANILLPEQISKYWDVIRFAMENTDTDNVNGNSDKFSNILSMMLGGRLQCWFGWQKGREEGEKIPKYIAVTMVVVNHLTEEKDVLIESLFGFDSLTDEDWAEAWSLVSKWGKANECKRVLAYSNVQRVIEMAKFVSGTTTTFITIPIQED
jgi:hypothetical protein